MKITADENGNITFDLDCTNSDEIVLLPSLIRMLSGIVHVADTTPPAPPPTVAVSTSSSPITLPPKFSAPASLLDDGPRRTPDGRIASKRRTPGKRSRAFTPNPPAPEGRWPDLFYITATGLELVKALREYGGDGLTGHELGELLGVDPVKASQRANRLRLISPLLKLERGRFSLTEIGLDSTLRFQVSDICSSWNKKRGWDAFMAVPLPDGKPKKTRK